MKEPKPIISEDEREDYESSERGEWVSTGDRPAEAMFWQELAKRTLDGKRRRISIAIPERDLARLKTKAAEKGMPYQTLINSILHEYVDG